MKALRSTIVEHPADVSTDGKVESLERCVLDLVHVNRLPPEILTRVARFLSRRDLCAGLRVCRYWYNVMMSPELWSDIDLDQIYNAQIFLVRSNEAPVDVEITQVPTEMQLSVLSTCSSRIRSLNISSSAVRENLLTRFSDTPAPLMRNLRITRAPWSSTYSQLPSTLFTGNLPSLRTLVLADISSDLTHFILPNLTTFELRHVTNSSATLSLSSLLDLFERSPFLENLHFNYHSRYDDTVAPKRVIALHHAKCISISGQLLIPNDTSRGLLAHLSLPSGVVVKLSVCIHEPDRDIVARTIPLHHDLIPCTKSLKKIEFQRLSCSSCFVAFSGDNGALCIFAKWQGTSEGSVARAICSFGPLDVSGVETLAVRNYRGNHEHFTQALRSLVNLRSLSLGRCDSEVSVYALRQEGTSPRLRHLAMDSHARGLHVCDLLEMTKARNLRDQELETLSFKLSSRGDLVGDISWLQKYVGCLEYTTDGKSRRLVL